MMSNHKMYRWGNRKYILCQENRPQTLGFLILLWDKSPLLENISRNSKKICLSLCPLLCWGESLEQLVSYIAHQMSDLCSHSLLLLQVQKAPRAMPVLTGAGQCWPGQHWPPHACKDHSLTKKLQSIWQLCQYLSLSLSFSLYVINGWKKACIQAPWWKSWTNKGGLQTPHSQWHHHILLFL